MRSSEMMEEQPMIGRGSAFIEVSQCQGSNNRQLLSMRQILL